MTSSPGKGRSFFGTRAAVVVLVLAVLSLLVCVAMLVVGGVVLWSTRLPAPVTPGTSLPPTSAATPAATLPPTPLQAATATTAPLGNPTVTPPATATAASTATPTAAPTAMPTATPVVESLPFETEVRLLAAERPQRDLRALAERLTGQGPIPEVVQSAPQNLQVGDRAEFWVGNVDTLEQHKITAVLHHVTEHLYMWVQEGVSFNSEALVRSAEEFESHIYPTTRALFGSEWSPGVDGDPRLYILNAASELMGFSVAGYYSSADEYSRLANPYSNEHEMFYVALDGGMRPGSEFYNGVLMHEFQHMIHWASDRNEDTWINEGCSELAAYVGGYDPGGFDGTFLSNPDLQLNTWPELESSAPHYGGSYLFMLYLYGRFGPDLIQSLVAHPADGIQGLEAVLAAEGLGFEEVFGDWLIANYVDGSWSDAGGIEARYSYPDRRLRPLAIDQAHRSYPVQRQGDVAQYGADYIELRLDGDLRLSFAGEREARLVPAGAHSGRYAWWSNRGDDSDTTLTRAFDLRALERATLQVHMWYDIEDDWDYAYVEVSPDGGATWEILAGPSSTADNPNGNSFGPAYTGSSEGWIEERLDLSAYAGRQVLVRFEYVTDDAVNRPGWLIDDVCLVEAGLCDDFEAGPGEWEARGFVYSDNRVRQRYLVQVALLDSEDTLRVVQVPLDALQRGAFELRGLDRRTRAVLVISAMAPVTTERASYEYGIERLQ